MDGEDKVDTNCSSKTNNHQSMGDQQDPCPDLRSLHLSLPPRVPPYSQSSNAPPLPSPTFMTDKCT